MQWDGVIRDLLLGRIDEVRDQTSQHGLMRDHDHGLRGPFQLENHRLQPLNDVAVALSPPCDPSLPRLLRVPEVELIAFALRGELGELLAHLFVGQVLAHARVDLVERGPAHAAVAVDVHGGLHGAALAAGPHGEALHVHLLERRDESTREPARGLRLAEVLRVLPAEVGEVGVAADAVLEVVLGLAVASEVDGLRLGVQVHHEGNDRRGEVAAHVVGDVALPVVLIDLHDAIDRVLLLLQIVVASD